MVFQMPVRTVYFVLPLADVAVRLCVQVILP